jgi:DNA-binding CsgD family transcriptional regulator
MGPYLGLRMAHGRLRNFRRACRRSCSAPRRFRWARMRPTMEVETLRISRWSSTTSLSLAQRGYCLRRDNTRSANLRRPGGPAHPARVVRVFFERAQIVAIEAPLPAIKCLSFRGPTMRMLFRGEFGHVNGHRPRGKLPRASRANGNSVSSCPSAAGARTIKRVAGPSETTSSHSAGFILLDAFLRPLNADEEAVSILSYPEIPRRSKRFDDFLTRQIESVLLKQNGAPHSRFPDEVTSGKRKYRLRVFTLKSHMGNGEPGWAILLERNHRPTIDLGRIAQKFRLTQRETEALGLLMQGQTTKEIACRMDISPNTAKTFLRSLMFKTGACDKSGVLAKILQFSDGASG